MLIVHGLTSCDTVRKARRWLTDAGQEHTFVDLRRQVPDEALLSGWVVRLGAWEPLLNRKGTTWRGLSEAVRAAVVDEETAIEVMMAQPSVIKRPVVQWPDGRVTVGFSPAQFEQMLAHK